MGGKACVKRWGFLSLFLACFPLCVPFRRICLLGTYILGDVTSTLTWHICVTTTKNDFFGPPLCLSMYTYMWRLWGVGQDFPILGGSAPFVHPHHIHIYIGVISSPSVCELCDASICVLSSPHVCQITVSDDDGDGEPPCIVSLR